MAIFPSVMGRENEFDLKIVEKRKKTIYSLPNGSEIISQMEADLLEKFGAVPFGRAYLNFGCNQDAREALVYFLRNLGGGLFYSRIIDGVILTWLGRIHREAISPYLEISTIPCTDPFELCRITRASEQIAGFLGREASSKYYEVQCFNAVSDRKGIHAKSCGMHDNHLISRDFYNRLFPREARRKIANIPKDEDGDEMFFILPEFMPRPLKKLINWRILGIILRGDGKIGHDLGTPYAHYQISSRSDFIMDQVSGNTVSYRPIINTRDEPHADEEYLGRLHLINGEGNRLPWSKILSVGSDALVLAALADDELNLDWDIPDPINTLQALSRDLSFKKEIPIVSGKNKTAGSRLPLDLFSEVLDKLERYISWAHVPSWCYTVLGEAQRVCALLKTGDPDGEVAKMLDWAIKAQFISTFIDRKLKLNSDNPRSWHHPRVQAIDLDYHRLDDERLWQVIAKQCEVRDFEKFSAPYGEPSADPKNPFWKGFQPQYTRAYLMWLLTSDPHLRERSTILDWEKVKIWNDSPRDAQAVLLGDPRKFSEANIGNLLKGDLDFSTQEKRALFIKKLKENRYPEPAAEITPRLFVQSQDKRLKLAPRKFEDRNFEDIEDLIQESLRLAGYGSQESLVGSDPTRQPMPREPEDLYERSMGNLEVVEERGENDTPPPLAHA